jgi:hypothetical protein
MSQPPPATAEPASAPASQLQPPPATVGPAAATAEGADSGPTPGGNPQDAVAVAGSKEGAETAEGPGAG